MMGKVLDKLFVKVSESEKGLHFFFVGRDGPIRHSRYFDRIHPYQIVRDDNSKIFHLCPFELTLFWFQEKIVFVKDLYHSFDHFPMLFQSLTEDKDVIKRDYSLPFTDHIFKDIVH